MSRSGYSDDIDNWDLIKWRGQVASAIRGRRGQKLLHELAQAMDAMPVRELYPNELKTADGQFCALGVVGNARGIELEKLDAEDHCAIADAFDIAHQLAQEIAFINDEAFGIYTHRFVDFEICGPVRTGYPHFESRRQRIRVPNENHAKERWAAVRQWVAENLIATHETKNNGGGL